MEKPEKLFVTCERSNFWSVRPKFDSPVFENHLLFQMSFIRVFVVAFTAN